MQPLQMAGDYIKLAQDWCCPYVRRVYLFGIFPLFFRGFNSELRSGLENLNSLLSG